MEEAQKKRRGKIPKKSPKGKAEERTMLRLTRVPPKSKKLRSKIREKNPESPARRGERELKTGRWGQKIKRRH